jgi:hypothetical protein
MALYSSPIRCKGVETGLQEKQEQAQINIFPSRTGDVLNVKTNLQGEYNINICDIQGRTLISKSKINSEQQIDVSSLKDGLYFVYIQNNEVMHCRKFEKID